MEVTANREFGQLMYDLIHGRLVEAGVAITPVVVTGLSGLLETAAREVRECAGELWRSNQPKNQLAAPGEIPQWLQTIVNWNPRMQLIVRTFLPMVWLSLLEPGDDQRAVQVIPHTNEFFVSRGYRELTEKEATLLNARIIMLCQRPYAREQLGAAGYALYCSAQRPIARTPIGSGRNAKARRRQFMQEARAACLAVEHTRELAERKGHACVLGEKLEAELRASRAKKVDPMIERFWDEFNLFFSGSQLAK